MWGDGVSRVRIFEMKSFFYAGIDVLDYSGCAWEAEFVLWVCVGCAWMGSGVPDLRSFSPEVIYLRSFTLEVICLRSFGL